MMQAKAPTLQIDGTEMHFMEQGEGEPLRAYREGLGFMKVTRCRDVESSFCAHVVLTPQR